MVIHDMMKWTISRRLSKRPCLIHTIQYNTKMAVRAIAFHFYLAWGRSEQFLKLLLQISLFFEDWTLSRQRISQIKKWSRIEFTGSASWGGGGWGAVTVLFPRWRVFSAAFLLWSYSISKINMISRTERVIFVLYLLSSHPISQVAKRSGPDLSRSHLGGKVVEKAAEIAIHW